MVELLIGLKKFKNKIYLKFVLSFNIIMLTDFCVIGLSFICLLSLIFYKITQENKYNELNNFTKLEDSKNKKENIVMAIPYNPKKNIAVI